MNPVRIALVLLFLQTAVTGASIEGTVVDRVSGTPLPGISVELSGIVGIKVETITTSTDKNGHFVLKNVPAGPAFWLVATPPVREHRYMPTVYGQRGLTGPGVQITLRSNQAMKDIRLALMPMGTISGRVLNEKGKPAANKTVLAVSPNYNGGSKARDHNEAQSISAHVALKGTATTNSHGEYRISGLPPGQYYLSVSGKTEMLELFASVIPGPTTQVNDTEDYYAPIFFPGTTDPTAALPVDLPAGTSVNDIEIKISPVRFRRVRGVVIDDATGMRVPTAQLLIVPQNAPPDSRYTHSVEANKGSFEMNMILPGAYFIVAYANVNGRLRTGRASIDVGADHLENVTVRVGPGFDLSGQIVASSSSSESSRARVILRPKPPSEPGILQQPTKPSLTLENAGDHRTLVIDNGFVRSAVAVPAVEATMAAKGRFSFDNVAPWEYTIEAILEDKSFYVQSIRLGTVDVQNDGLRIDGPLSEALEIVLGSNAGSLDGRVVDERSEPIDNIRVTLVPAGVPQNRPDLFKLAWTDTAGRFQMDQIPPGDYTLYAWEQVEDGAWRDPGFLRLYQGHGTAVHVRERSHETIETRLIPPWF